MQIQRMTGLSYKSALFMMHRVRFAMAEDWKGQPKLSGIVESDETYVGGEPRNRQSRPGPVLEGAKKCRSCHCSSAAAKSGHS
jgi:hypothetical protein